MALIDHFAPNAGTDLGDNGFERFPTHQFITMLSIGLNGGFGTQADARARMITAFNLQTLDEPQLDTILADINQGAPVSPAKNQLFRNIEDSFLAFEAGFITQTEAETHAGL